MRRTPGEKIRIAYDVKGGDAELFAPAPYQKRKIWTDAGRFAECQS